MQKKAVVGIGVLIIFISAILISAIAAGVILNTQSTLQQNALQTGSEAEKSVTSTVQIQNIKAIDNENGFSTIEMKIKVTDGGEDLRLNRTSLGITTDKASATLEYDGVEMFTTKDRRTLPFKIDSTPQKMKTDIDDDAKQESIYMLDPDTIRIDMSTGEYIDIDIPSIATPPVNLTINETLEHNGLIKGYLQINTTTTTADEIPPDSATVLMKKPETGKFSATHLIKVKNHMEGVIRYGEIVSITAETPNRVNEEEIIHFNFYTPKGIPEATVVYTPEVMTIKYIKLYP